MNNKVLQKQLKFENLNPKENFPMGTINKIKDKPKHDQRWRLLYEN